jgi:hypothetical protein
MVRVNATPDPSQRLFEAYLDFSGGRNSEISNEKLRDNEYPILDNVDLLGRGSCKRRTGRRKVLDVASSIQGMFPFFRQGNAKPDLIIAAGGKLYVKPFDQTTASLVPLTDSGAAFTFQTTLSVEAVQYIGIMFIATGTKLVEVSWDSTNGWKAVTTTPYQPTVMEAIYIGTNALAANPDTFIQDGVDTALSVSGIKPVDRTGIVNQTTNMTAFINKPASITSVDYKWEYKKSADTTWTLGRDWTNGTTGKTWGFKPDTAVNYDIRVTARDNANQGVAITPYVLSGYKVNQTQDVTANVIKPSTGIQRCRKIMLHWDRILLAGDDLNPYQIYISDLTNPRYVPTTNTISFDTGKLEPITSIVRFRDMLIVFTKSTIQTVTGHTPETYQHSLIHDGIGCIADRSAIVTGNVITFLSSEGVQQLTPNQFILEVLNVKRVDVQVHSEVMKMASQDAVAMLYNSQYWLCFPSSNVMYRLYYDNGNVWVRDISSKINFVDFVAYSGDIYEAGKDGKVYIQDTSRFDDDGEAYTMTAEGKFYDLSAAFNWKKLKRIYVLAKHFGTDTNLGVYVQADSNIVITPDKGVAKVTTDGWTTWEIDTIPNFFFYKGTSVGTWVLGQTPLGDPQVSVQKASIMGKCRRVKVRITHAEPVACEVFGFGLEFRAKRP